MEGGRRTSAAMEGLEDARRRARSEMSRLPGRLLELESADPPFPVEVTPALEDHQRRVIAEAVAPGAEGEAPAR
jgi:nicotinate phosphoribosyltransferase